MRTIGYVRVSTDGQAREGVSLDNQKRRFRPTASFTPRSCGDHRRRGEVSKDLNRDGIRALVDLIERRDIKAEVFYKLDRLSGR